MRRFLSMLFAIVAMCSMALCTQPVSTEPMQQSRISQAEHYANQIRDNFKLDTGHEPRSSIEYMRWLDKQVERAHDFSAAQKDAMVQTFGAALGQVLVRDFGGHWVTVPSEEDAPGIDLPSHEVAFVFNRAARRILNSDPIGFVKFYQATESRERGTPLPSDFATKPVGN